MAGILENIFDALYRVFIGARLCFYIIFVKAKKKEPGACAYFEGMGILRCNQEQISFAVIKLVFIDVLHSGAIDNIDQLKETFSAGCLREPFQFFILNFKRLVQVFFYHTRKNTELVKNCTGIAPPNQYKFVLLIKYKK